MEIVLDVPDKILSAHNLESKAQDDQLLTGHLSSLVHSRTRDRLWLLHPLYRVVP